MIPVDLLNYQLIRLLGRGGMGEVYLARNKNIDQLVAVKALHPRYAKNPMLRARFKQEAVLLNSLNHNNIVKFLNFVENEYGVFLIMEYVEGCTLEDFITKKNGLIVEQKAWPMMKEILQAFSYAHQRGIVHRDIKPSNIFIDKEGHIKVLDFGIAQIISEAGVNSGKQASMGTPAYMSPEQVYGQPIGQRSDIYSLGVLFHQMLTGRAPYDSTTMSEVEIRRHVVQDKLPRMKNYYPYISEGLQTIIDKATTKIPEQRFASCDDMLVAIKGILDPEKRQRAPFYMGAAIAGVLLLAGVGIWDYLRTKVDYYKDYVEVRGVAKGVGHLSSREHSHRQMSYRVESSRWKVRRVTLVNSQDKPIFHQDTEHTNSRFTDTYYYYTDYGQVDYKKVYDPYGKLLYKIDYDENLKVAMFKHDDEHGTAKRLLSSTTQLYDVNNLDRSAITRYLLTYDEDGRLLRMEYASGEDNTPVGDADNIYGQQYTYDSKGRVVEVKFLGQDGKIRGNKIGLAIKRYKYDDNDDWTQVSYLSADGKPSHDGNNCTVVNLSYDKWGNRTAERYLTYDGKPSVRTDCGVCGFLYDFDDHGNCVLRTCVDGNDRPIYGINGVSKMAMAYDENGFVTKVSYLDTNDCPVSNSKEDGVSSLEFVNDERGLQLSMSNFDTKGKPMENSFGIFKYVSEYDSIGNMYSIAYYDSKKQPARMGGYHCSTRFEYDSESRRLSCSYYDKNGKLCYDSDGVARVLYSYDKLGNVTKYEYYGTDGKSRANSKYGYAVEEIKYDELGNIKDIRHYNATLTPCLGNGYFIKEYEYDSSTNFNTVIRYYDAARSVTSTEHYDYDSNGNITTAWKTSAKGSLIGVVEHHEFDGNNRVIHMYYTNLAGRKVNCLTASYAESRLKYDERGNVIEMSFYDIAGRPACDNMKTHKRIKKYDSHNNYIYEKNLGTNGKPLRGTGVYPEANVRYDVYGNITRIECLDGYGKPYICPDGYYIMEKVYGEHNLLTSMCYKGINGNLVMHKGNGYAKVTNSYNDHRNPVEEKYFNAAGKVIYMIRYKYNERNSPTELGIYNAAGRLDDNRSGFSRLTFTYAADGVTPLRKSYYNAYGLLAWQNYNTRTGEWGQLCF